MKAPLKGLLGLAVSVALFETCCAGQVMMPVDHLLLPEVEALPALVVVRLANGLTHFVVAWRRHGRFVQVMDPAVGRRWPTCQRFLDELYTHPADPRRHLACLGGHT